MKIKINLISNQVIEYDNVSYYKIEDKYARIEFEFERYIDISEERSICTTITFSLDRNEFRGIIIC